MSYGITVENLDGRVTIDETYIHFYPRIIKNSVSGGDLYPGTSHQTGDLVFVRCKSNGYIGVGGDQNFSQGNRTYMNTIAYPSTYHTPPASGYTVVFGSKVAGNVAPGGGYGMEVYNSSTELVYSTAPYGAFRIVATGYFPGSSDTTAPATRLTFPTDIGEFEDLSKIYVLSNNTSHFRAYVSSPFIGLNVDVLRGYQYEYTTGNRGRVHVCAQSGLSGQPTVGIGTGYGLEYLIVEFI